MASSLLFLPILKKKSKKNHRLGNHTSTLPLIHSFTTLSCPCPCPPLPLPPPPLFRSIPFVPTPPCCLLCSLRCPLSISCLPEFKTRSLCACCWGGAWKRRSTDELRVPRRVSPTPWFRFSLGGWEKRGMLTWMPTAAVLRFWSVPGAACCCCCCCCCGIGAWGCVWPGIGARSGGGVRLG